MIKPEVQVCLGATAAKALLGRDFRVTIQRGQVLPSNWPLRHWPRFIPLPSCGNRPARIESARWSGSLPI